MSLLRELMAEQGVDIQKRSHGEDCAIAINGKDYTAIIGKLRVESVQSIFGGSEQSSDRDTCQVSVWCEPGEIKLDSSVLIRKFTTGDASISARQMFHVQSIISVTDTLTTFEASRESLSKVQARGTEGNTR